MIVASGENFSDALSASSIAGKLKAPILLIDGKNGAVGAVTIDYIEKNKKNIEKIKVIGGPSLVSESIYKSIDRAIRETKDNKKPDVKPNPEKPNSKPDPNPKPKPEQPKLSDKPKDGIWYGTAFEGYGPEAYGASIVKVEIKDGKIKLAEAIKHCASDDYYIGLAKKLLPLVKDKNTSDVDSIIKELSNGDGKNKGTYADAVTGATRTSKGYAMAIKNTIERARKFESDKKEQKIAYIKISGKNINRPNIDRIAIAEKSNLKNGTKANFDFVKYDVMISDGTIKEDVKFSELEKYGFTSNYKQGELLNTDKDHIILTVKDETGYAVESIRLSVRPKVEKVKVRPTHALITFEKSNNPGESETEQVKIEEDKFSYDTKKTYKRKIEKVELFKDDKVISAGVFKEGFNYWWFDKLKNDLLKENEKWEFDNYKIITRIEQPEISKPEEPKPPQPPQEVKDYYPAKYILKDKQTKEIVAEIEIDKAKWEKSPYSNNVRKDILKKYKGKLNKDSFTVEVFNKDNQSLEVTSINVLNKMMHEIKTKVPDGELEERALHVFWNFNLEETASAKITDYHPVKYIFKDKETQEEVARIEIEENGWAEVPYSKNIFNKEISKKYENNLNDDSFEVEVLNKENQKIEVKSVKVISKKMHEVKTVVSDKEDYDERTLHVFWKFKF